MADMYNPYGGVPTGQQQDSPSTATQGVDIIKALIQERGNISNQIGETTKAALTPVSKAGPMALNEKALTSHQFTPYEQDNSRVVGHGNARTQGIGNVVKGVLNIVGSYQQKKSEQDVASTKVDLQNIFAAQHGMQQAQEVLKQDPNNADAKATVAKNQEAINSILTDPKRRKKVAEAMNINFTDPSKNNKPEHAAYAQATKSFAEQLQEKAPKVMGPNEQAQQKLMILEGQQKGIDSAIKEIAPIASAEIREKGLMDRTDKQQTGANLRTEFTQNAANARKQAEIDSRERQTQQKIVAGFQLEKLKNNDKLGQIAVKSMHDMARTMATLNSREKLFNSKTFGPGQAQKFLVTTISAIDKERTGIAESILKTKTMRDEIQKQQGKNLAFAGQIEQYNQHIRALEDSMKYLDESAKKTQDKLNKLNLGEDSNAGTQSESSSRSTTTPANSNAPISTTPVGGDEDTDDEDPGEVDNY